DPTHVSERFFGEIIDRMSMHTGKASVEPSPTTHSSRPAELAALRGPKKGSVRVLTVGSIPPEWGGSVAGGVATVHRSLVEAFLKSNAVDLVGVIPTRRVDESLIPGVVPLVQDSTEEGFKELASSVDVILMNHITHRWADYQARTRETPCIGFVHSWSKYLRSSDPDAVRRHLKQNMIGMTCLVFPSRFCADEGESLGFEYPVGVRVIRNSVPQLYESEPPIRDRRGVVFIGALNDWKRPDLVIEACAQLQVPLSIVGDGPNRARLEYLAGDGDVQFKGELPPSEVRELLLASEALCVPSRSESFGLVYLEAAASGTPSVGHGPSISELFETVGVPCGVGVPPDATVEQVVTALREVLDHQWDHRMMHQGAIRALGPDRFAAQFVDLVTEVASSEESDGTGCR
ncbi:MAG: glycosyltransferase family 4 protein, partial [Actinomycetota bacterium]|nr:glycosyltransferase family 4 protein [Actinomycetota bacterium]